MSKSNTFKMAKTVLNYNIRQTIMNNVEGWMSEYYKKLFERSKSNNFLYFKWQLLQSSYNEARRYAGFIIFTEYGA